MNPAQSADDNVGGDATDPLSFFKLNGKVAVVTGAGSGIGEATAECLAAVGAKVVLGDLDADAVTAVGQRIRDRGGEAEVLPTDVSVRDDVVGLVTHAVETFGRLDCMANVAGVAGDGALRDVTEAELLRVMAVNVNGVFFGCQAAADAMAPAGAGSIVNVSSTAIDSPTVNNSVYALTKAAVAMLTMSLAAELGPSGIRVNAIAPGVTLTKFTTRLLYDERGRRDEARYAERIELYRGMSPIRMVGGPIDQALQILYLMSDASRFVTGAILRANGGVSMVW